MKQRISILHVFNDPKFSFPFLQFLLDHGIDTSEHFLFQYRCTKNTCLPPAIPNIFAKHFFSPIANLHLLPKLFIAKRIIIHSLASPFLIFYLFLFPSLARKSFWVIWGKDLYFYNVTDNKTLFHHIYEFFRKKVIRNIGHIITDNKGDYDLAKQWYGAKGINHNCFMYPSNIVNKAPWPLKDNQVINILVGNSADPSNCHEDAFKLLQRFKDANIRVITPLSYGSKRHAKLIQRRGREIFADKFVPLVNLLPLEQYNGILQQIDIAIFAHKRQQARGNIVSLLAAGATVYLRKNVTTWNTLSDLGVKLRDLNDLSLVGEKEEVRKANKRIVEAYHSANTLLTQLKPILTVQQ